MDKKYSLKIVSQVLNEDFHRSFGLYDETFIKVYNGEIFIIFSSLEELKEILERKFSFSTCLVNFAEDFIIII